MHRLGMNAGTASSAPRSQTKVLPVGLLSALSMLACGAPASAEVEPSEASPLGQVSQAFVNGSDDRLEYFHLSEAAQRAALERFTVALMPTFAAEALIAGDMASLPTWGELDGLCPSEPFVDQPSAAFCSGVLVDWDLILTSGHCIAAVPLSDLRIVFGYYYAAPGELAVSRNDVYAVERVVTSRRDPNSDGERLDFAWLALTEEVSSPHEPASVHTLSEAAVPGEPVISIGAGGGVPLKLDAGGKVRDTRPDFDDYFVADTDTSEGSSGGGLFDQDLAVLGTLARGAPDFTLGADGCWTTAREPDPEQALEEFTYAHRSVAALCEVEPERRVCSSECEQPCGPISLPLTLHDEDGCSVQPGGPRSAATTPFAALLLLPLTALAWRRRRAMTIRISSN